MLELSRYVVLNPVNAGMAEAAGDWQWTSYRAVMGRSAAPDWFGITEPLDLFHDQRGPARRAFARFVADGVDAVDPYYQMPRPSFLDAESFIKEVIDKSGGKPISAEVPKRLRPALSLEQIAKQVARETAQLPRLTLPARTRSQISPGILEFNCLLPAESLKGS